MHLIYRDKLIKIGDRKREERNLHDCTDDHREG